MNAFKWWVARTLGIPVVTKELLLQMKSLDFVPDGQETVRPETLKFRKTGECEFFQCCQMVGTDAQSGPFYCGQIAHAVVGTQEDGFIGLCKGHLERPNRVLFWATINAKHNLERIIRSQTTTS